MTDATRTFLRILVIAIAALQTAVIAVFLVFFAFHALISGDQLGRSIAVAATVLTCFPLALAVPALVLGLRGRMLPLALGLSVATVVAIVLIYRFA